MEAPTRITLKVGEIATLRLPGLGPAGYTWVHEVVGNGDVVDISVATEKSSRLNQEEGRTIVGSGKDELFIIRAIKEGHATVCFSQKRPWEYDRSPLKEHILEVIAND